MTRLTEQHNELVETCITQFDLYVVGGGGRLYEAVTCWCSSTFLTSRVIESC